MTSSSVSPRQK